MDQITALQTEAKVRKGKGKSVLCAVLGAALVAANEQHNQEHVSINQMVTVNEQKDQITESL